MSVGWSWRRGWGNLVLRLQWGKQPQGIVTIVCHCILSILCLSVNIITNQIIYTWITMGSFTIVCLFKRKENWIRPINKACLLGSHPNDEDAHFRLSDAHVFTFIFTYVDHWHLFGKIKPLSKLFFMAVDGVTPRAKMNQQRSRHFRTAREAKEVREQAEAKGGEGRELLAEKAFHCNFITPGLRWFFFQGFVS